MDRFMALSEADRKKRIELQGFMEIQMEEYSTGKYWSSYNDSPMSGGPEQAIVNAFVEQIADAYGAWIDYWSTLNPHNRQNVSQWKLPSCYWRATCWQAS